MKLYEEQHVELLSDMYSTGCELVLDTGTACFDRLLTKNICKCKTAEKLNLRQPERILQICHSTGEVKLDAAEPKEDGLHLEGVLEVGLLYLTTTTRLLWATRRRWFPSAARRRQAEWTKTASIS